MRVLLLSCYYEPEVAASLYLSTDLNEALAKNGIYVDVYTPMPCRGVDEETIERYKKIPLEEKCDSRLKIHRFSMPREGKNSLIRAFRYFYLNIKLFFKGLFCKTDLIFLYSTPPTNGFMGAVLKFFKRVPVVYDLQDIFPDSMVNAGMTTEGSLIYKIGRWAENISYKHADKIIVISEDFKENIMEKGVPEEKIEVIYNWVDENAVVDVKREDNPLFDKYELSRDKFYICYSGNIGFSQNMEMLCEIAKELEGNRDIGFVIVGDGAFKPKLEEIIENMDIKNITLIPFQDYSDISYVFSLGDMGLIISKKGIGTNSVPSKTWSIMSAKRAVLASFDRGSELEKIIKETECGICVEADNKELLKEAILTAYEGRDKLHICGENGRAFILENLTKEIGTERVMKSLLSTVYKTLPEEEKVLIEK